MSWKTLIAGTRVDVLTRAATAQAITALCHEPRDETHRPQVHCSVNGQVVAQAHRQNDVRLLIEQADMVNVDSMPMVFASRFVGAHPLPERVATTDLIHDVAKKCQAEGLSFYLLGAQQETIEKATAKLRKLYPQLRIIGFRHGYFTSHAEEEDVIRDINALRPDVLWLGMGMPRELQFAYRWQGQLSGVGVIKTCGGCFKILAGDIGRAPRWIQNIGFEWLYRMFLEPRHVFWRYLSTNSIALGLILKQVAFERLGDYTQRLEQRQPLPPA